MKPRHLLAAVLCALFFAAAPSDAATFAAYSFEGPSRFRLLVDGGLFTATTNIKFNYVASGVNGVPIPGFSSHDAQLKIDGSLVAGSGATNGILIAQDAVTISWSITGNSNAGGEAAFFGKNFLSGTATIGAMVGTPSGTQGNVLSSSTGMGAVITYASDFLAFGIGPRGFSWALSNIEDTASGNPGLQFDAILKNIKAFRSSISGNFDAEPKPVSVPEPGMLAMIVGVGVAGSLFLRRRRA